MVSQPTKLEYLEQMHKLEGTAKVLEVLEVEQGKHAVILDSTILYAQGGGQPSDKGMLEGKHSTFSVEQVRFKDGLVYHTGIFSGSPFKLLEEVKIKVDPEIRKLHSRLHTAGHVIDVALRNLGLEFVPTKGFHFPEGPYVEYQGTIPQETREQLVSKLESEANHLIQEGFEVKSMFVPREKLQDLCYDVPSHMPDKPSRVVIVAGPLGCPCGGTHVKNIKEIGQLSITKIKNVSGSVRVSYMC